MLLKASFNMTTHDHTRLKTQEAITKLGWIVLPYPPYSPDLAPSDFHLFAALKDDHWEKVWESL
jgi:histone-lysine N-methyltransferase SETMAR